MLMGLKLSDIALKCLHLGFSSSLSISKTCDRHLCVICKNLSIYLSKRQEFPCLWEIFLLGRFPKPLSCSFTEFSQLLYLLLLHTSSPVQRGTSVCFLPYQADIYICEENSTSLAKNLYLIVVIKHYFLSSKHTSDRTNYFKWLIARGKAIVVFPKPLNFYRFKGVLKRGYEAIV